MHPLVPTAALKEQSLENVSLHKWGECTNQLNLHLFQESIQNWQLRKTKPRTEFHLQGCLSAVSLSPDTQLKSLKGVEQVSF